MPRYDWLNDIYLKFPMLRTVGADGTEVPMTVKMFPPYVQPVRYWASFKTTGDDATVIDPRGVMPYRVRGVATGLPATQTLQEAAADVPMSTIWARYATEQETEALVPDETLSDEADVGILGDSDRTQRRRMNFFDHKKVLGLPGNAVFANSSAIVYTDAFKRSGPLGTKYFRIDEPKMVGVGARADSITANTDEGQIMWADMTDFQDLYNEILGISPGIETSGGVSGQAGIDPDVVLWMQEGFVSSTNSLDQPISVFGQMTIQAKVYQPANSKYITLA